MNAAFLGSVVAASLVGSLHCAGMCGGFVAAYASSADGKQRVLAHVAYNAGRLVTYAALGAVAGAIGHALDLAGKAAGLAHVAALVTGTVLVLSGLTRFAPTRKLVRLKLRAPGKLAGMPSRLLTSFARFPVVTRSGLLGLATTLLPCGWLYAFAAGAAGTGSASRGATVMAAFWLGSLPMLLGVGLSFQMLTARFGRYLPRVSAAIVTVVGLFTLLGRSEMPAFADESARAPRSMSAAQPSSDDCPCHHRHGVSSTHVPSKVEP